MKKKEIGKLIELLNEYGRQKEGVYWIDYQADMDFTNREKTLFCSKYRGWIEWLVENDKIDRKRKMIKQVWTGGTLDLMNFDRIQDIEYYSIEETLLMLLAISDTPIDFLCEILK